MTPRELIKILLKHLDRKTVMVGVPDSSNVFEIDESVLIFFSNDDPNHNQATNREAPLVLMGKEWR